MAGSVQITLDFALRPDAGLVGILTGLAERAALPQQVPSLVELHLEGTESTVFLGLVDLVVGKPGAQLLLLGDEFVDSRKDVRVRIRVIALRVRSHAVSLPDYGVTRGH